MDTKINKELISNWATQIFNDNEKAITNLNEFKTIVTNISESYKNESADAFITNMTIDLENNIKCHTDMESLKDFLEQVITNAENA